MITSASILYFPLFAPESFLIHFKQGTSNGTVGLGTHKSTKRYDEMEALSVLEAMFHELDGYQHQETVDQ